MVAKASTPRRIAKVTNLDKFLSSSNYLVLLPARITVPGRGCRLCIYSEGPDPRSTRA